jgi:hypothetical protein
MSKLRQENRAQYYGAIAKMSEGDQKEEYEEKAKNAQKGAEEAAANLDKAADSQKDSEEAQQAEEVIASGDQEKIDAAANQAEKDNAESDKEAAKKVGDKQAETSGLSEPTKKDEPKKKFGEGNKLSPEEAAKEAKKVKIEKLEKDLEGAKKAMEGSDDPKKIQAINKNLEKITAALKTLKEALEYGMDPELFELEIWAIEASMIMVERKIYTDLYDALYD